MNILICRVSSKKQLEQGYSIDAQEKKGLKYSKDTGIEYDKIYKFDETAKDAGLRKNFQKVMKILQNGDNHIVVVEELDRLLRNEDDAYEIEKLVKEGCLTVHLIDEKVVYDKNANSHEKLLVGIKKVLAKFYIDLLAERSKKGVKEKIERGEYPGYPPNGFWINPVTRKIEWDKREDRAKLTVFALKEALKGKDTLDKLVKKMRRLGYTTKPKRHGKEGRLITKPELCHILKNPFYYGEFRWGGELYPNTGINRDRTPSYKPMITKKQHEQILRNLSDNNRSQRTGNFFKFRKLVTCDFCGCFLTADTNNSKTNKAIKKGKAYTYYRCTNGKKAIDPDWYMKQFSIDHCPQESWKEEEIEAQALGALDKMHYDEQVFKWLKKELDADFESRMEVENEELKLLRTKETKKEVELKSIIRAIAIEGDEEIKEELRKEYHTIKDELEEIKADIELREEAKEINTEEMVESLMMFNNLKEQYENLPPDKQRELLELSFSKIFARRGTKDGTEENRTDGLYVIWNEPFSTLLEIGLDNLLAEWDASEGQKYRITKGKASVDSLD